MSSVPGEGKPARAESPMLERGNSMTGIIYDFWSRNIKESTDAAMPELELVDNESHK